MSQYGKAQDKILQKEYFIYSRAPRKPDRLLKWNSLIGNLPLYNFTKTTLLYIFLKKCFLSQFLKADFLEYLKSVRAIFDKFLFYLLRNLLPYSFYPLSLYLDYFKPVKTYFMYSIINLDKTWTYHRDSKFDKINYFSGLKMNIQFQYK